MPVVDRASKSPREAGMKLRLLFTDSVPQSCPTVYETDRGTFVVQGDTLTDPEARSGLTNMLPGEDAVEVPRATLLGAARIADGRSRLVAPDSEEFNEPFQTFEHSAFRLEALDRYVVPIEEEPVRRFLAGEPVDTSWLAPYLALVQEATAAGKRFQRVRVVPEPLPDDDYLRYEFAYYPHTIAAGEDIRVLSRAQAEALELPDRDFWLFDSRLVALMRFDREGHLHGVELTDEPQVVAHCCYWRDAALHHATGFERYVAEHGDLDRRPREDVAQPRP
jgi:hypothetical protein